MTFSVARISTSSLQIFVFLALVTGLAACGFQLRGTIELSDDIAPVYIEQKTTFELEREIKSLLATNKIKVVLDESQSKSKLVLLNETKKQRVLSVDGSGRAKEYLLTYTVNFTIKIEQSKEIKDTLSISRSLVFDPDAVLAVTNEAEILYKDMRRDVARLILLKLQAYSRKNTEQKASQEIGPVQTEPEKTP